MYSSFQCDINWKRKKFSFFLLFSHSNSFLASSLESSYQRRFSSSSFVFFLFYPSNTHSRHISLQNFFNNIFFSFRHAEKFSISCAVGDVMLRDTIAYLNFLLLMTFHYLICHGLIMKLNKVLRGDYSWKKNYGKKN